MGDWRCRRDDSRSSTRWTRQRINVRAPRPPVPSNESEHRSHRCLFVGRFRDRREEVHAVVPVFGSRVASFDPASRSSWSDHVIKRSLLTASRGRSAKVRAALVAANLATSRSLGCFASWKPTGPFSAATLRFRTFVFSGRRRQLARSRNRVHSIRRSLAGRTACLPKRFLSRSQPLAFVALVLRRRGANSAGAGSPCR